eukprot:TRINITY_DN11590_c0_g1_i1.p1 TRINITY_DN11590_c0_g1~~TRINITY_DN11590_c0_g1_i1.p1  ORF type:complete len:419 (+),score=140.39 TRINITY_DN11590_c0_g1_i1:61-1257(+)
MAGPLVPHDTWIEMDDREDDNLNETDRLVRYTNRGLCEAERDELRRVSDQAYRRWCVVGYVGGLFAVGYSFKKHGFPWGHVDILSLSANIGVVVGTIFHALTLHLAGLAYFPTHDKSGLAEAAHIAWLFCWASVVCQMTVLYIAVVRRHIDVLDPGPPNQIFSLHGFFAAQLLLKEGKLFDTRNLVTGERRVPSHVLRYVGVQNLKATTERLNVLYYTLGVAPCVIGLLVLVGVTVTLILWKHVSRRSRHEFDLADISAPAVLILSFFVVHLIFCRKADKALAEVNASPEMVRKNIAWVLHRTPLTHSYCLWLVWRNPEAYALTHASGVRWWERYAAALPSFQLTTRLLFLAQMRMVPEDAAWLPMDLVYEVLAFLAEGDQGSIIAHARRMKRRAVTL